MTTIYCFYYELLKLSKYTVVYLASHYKLSDYYVENWNNNLCKIYLDR